MRFHQSWYRAHVLDAACGPGPTSKSAALYGNMLCAEAAEAGTNFLTPAIFDVVRARIASGGGVERFRCLYNMLSSQPMCFNLFGPLVVDTELATRLLQSLFPGEVAEVRSVAIEWAPAPKSEYLGDATAFDAVIVYDRTDGERAFVAIETKLTEPFSAKYYKTARYIELTEHTNSIWLSESWPRLSDTRWNQLWRNHMLVEAVRQHRPSPVANNGRLALVRHPADPMIGATVDAYRSFLVDPDATFVEWPLDLIVDRWLAAAETDGERAWLTAFRDRYLDLALSKDAHRAATSGGLVNDTRP